MRPGVNIASGPTSNTAMRRLAILLFVLALPSVFAVPARVILIRHAEKPADHGDPHLTSEGRAHAVRWASWLTRTNAPRPDALFAPNPTSKHPSVRATETLEPVAKQLGIEVRMTEDSGTFERLAKSVLADPKLDGKTVVVCWVHQYLPQFAAALGVTPEPVKWKDEDYDGVYEITFSEGRAALRKTSAPRSR